MMCSLVRSVREAEQEARDGVSREGSLLLFGHGGAEVKQAGVGTPSITRGGGV